MNNDLDIIDALTDIKYRLNKIETTLNITEEFLNYLVSYLNENGDFERHIRRKKFQYLRDENIKDL